MGRAWDRLANEGDKAYAAFAAYRDAGAVRTLALVAQQLGKSTNILARWSSQYDWVRRVREYDDYLETEARKKFERDAIQRKVDMLKRHALAGKVLQRKGVDYIDKHGVDKSADAISAISKGIEIERKSEGLPDYLFEVMNVDDNELARQYHELLAQIGSVGSGDAETGNGNPPADQPAPETDQ